MKVAAWIEDQLKKNDWSKEVLADKVNQPIETITEWMSGTHVFSTDEIADLQAAFGESFSEWK